MDDAPQENWLMKPALEWLEDAEHGENNERCKMIAAILRDLWRQRKDAAPQGTADTPNEQNTCRVCAAGEYCEDHRVPYCEDHRVPQGTAAQQKGLPSNSDGQVGVTAPSLPSVDAAALTDEEIDQLSKRRFSITADEYQQLCAKAKLANQPPVAWKCRLFTWSEAFLVDEDPNKNNMPYDVIIPLIPARKP